MLVNTLCHWAFIEIWPHRAKSWSPLGVYVSFTLAPYWKYWVAQEIPWKLSFWSCPTKFCSVIPTSMPLYQYNQEPQKRCATRFVKMENDTSIKFHFQPIRTYNIGLSSQGTTNDYTKYDAIMNFSQIYCVFNIGIQIRAWLSFLYRYHGLHQLELPLWAGG